MYDISKIIADFDFKTLEQAKNKLNEYNASRDEESIGAELRAAPVQFAELASSRAQIERLLPSFEPTEFQALEAGLRERFSGLQERFAALEAAEAQLGRNRAEQRVFRDLEGILDVPAVDAVRIVGEHERTLRATLDTRLREKIEIALRIAKTRLLNEHGICECDEEASGFAARLVAAFVGLRKMSFGENPFEKYDSASKSIISDSYALVVRAFAGLDVFEGQCVKIYLECRQFLQDFAALQKTLLPDEEPTFSFSVFMDEFFGSEQMLFLTQDNRTRFRISAAETDLQLFMEACFDDDSRGAVCQKLDKLAERYEEIARLLRLLCDGCVEFDARSQAEPKKDTECIFQFLLDFLADTQQVGGAAIMLSRFEIRLFGAIECLYNESSGVLESSGAELMQIERDLIAQFEHSATQMISAACFLYYDLPPLAKLDFVREFSQNYTLEDYQAAAQVFECTVYLENRKYTGREMDIMQRHLEQYIALAQNLQLEEKSVIQGLLNMFQAYFKAIGAVISKSKVYHSSLRLSKLERLPSLVDVFAVVKSTQEYAPRHGMSKILNAISADLENIFSYLLPISIAKLADKIGYEINPQLELKYDQVRDLSMSDVIFRQQLIERRYFGGSSLLVPETMARVLQLGDYYNASSIEKTDFELLLQNKDSHPMLHVLLQQYQHMKSVIQMEYVQLTGQQLYKYLQAFNRHVKTTQDFVVDEKRVSMFRALYSEMERYLERPMLSFEKWLGLRELSAAIQSLLYNEGFFVDLSSFDLLKQYQTLVDCEFSGQVYSETEAVQIYTVVHCVGRVLHMRGCQLGFIVKRSSGVIEPFSESMLELSQVQAVIDYVYGLLINFIE